MALARPAHGLGRGGAGAARLLRLPLLRVASKHAPLCTGLDLAYTAGLVSRLEVMGVPYALRGGGGTILVPQARARRPRLALAGGGEVGPEAILLPGQLRAGPDRGRRERLDLSHLGRLQLDVLCQGQRCDLLVRSAAELQAALRAEIPALFEAAKDAVGLRGVLGFRAGGVLALADSRAPPLGVAA